MTCASLEESCLRVAGMASCEPVCMFCPSPVQWDVYTYGVLWRRESSYTKALATARLVCLISGYVMQAFIERGSQVYVVSAGVTFHATYCRTNKAVCDVALFARL